MKYRIAWYVTWPFRAYLRHTPILRGQGFIIRRVVLPCLPPPPAHFVTVLPGGGHIELLFRETLGYVTLLYGGFETAELESALLLARPGTIAFDVGSNVGLFAVVMAGAIGDRGSVIAVEPDPANVRRLRRNLALNGATNVQVVEAAAADRAGSLLLHLAPDPAYHSLGADVHSRQSTAAVAVDAKPMDAVWHDNGDPVVSLMKIDVEGAEMSVLEGSQRILTAHHPALIVEAGGARELEAVRAFLAPFGYRRQTRDGYMPWNHLFLWSPDD